MRGHEPFVIESFSGLWDRGDAESVPADHFNQADNIQFVSSGIETRNPLDKYLNALQGAAQVIVRAYNYVMQTGQSLLVLTIEGKIYHIIPGPTGADTDYTIRSILTVNGMSDFGFVAIAGRAYITPFKTYFNAQNKPYELGIKNQFVYVYNGSVSPLPPDITARKAAGLPPYNGASPSAADGLKPFTVYNDNTTGVVTAGIHLLTTVFNIDDGINPPVVNYGPLTVQFVIAPGDKKLKLVNIPLGPAFTTFRKIAMTTIIDINDPGVAGTNWYQAHLINDNTTTSLVIDVTDDALRAAGTISLGGLGSNLGMLVINSVVGGHSDIGFHIVGVVYETDSGYLTAPGPQFFASNTYVNTSAGLDVQNIPIPTLPHNVAVVKRHLVSTKAIPEYNGDQKGYQFFFIPNGSPPNMTDTNMHLSYYDSDLVADASHLIDNFSEIPAGVNLNTYHSRLVIVGEFGTDETLKGLPPGQIDNRSIARVSMPGEPEAISKVDGLIIAPLDGNPLTNVQEFRDILYLFKRTRTYAYSDNRDEPATWQEEVIDQGVGAPVHGIATVLDTGGVNVDFLLIADFSGLMIFNGVYARPELSWKIESYWLALDRDTFNYIQIVNDSLSKKIWLTLPENGKVTRAGTRANERFAILHADYGEGLDPKNINWARWIYDSEIVSLCLLDTNKLIIASGRTKKGLYFMNPTKAGWFDTYYEGNMKIPDPTIRTALLGE